MKIILSAFLILFQIFQSYSQHKLTLFDRPNTMIILSTPENEQEFKNIFKRKSTFGELESIKTLFNNFKKTKNVYFLKHPDDLSKIMKSIARKDAKELFDESYPRIGFSVIGHNNDGNFYFPNGATMKLQDLENKFQGVPAMFLSCSSNDYGVIGVDYNLTYQEAIKIAVELDNTATEMHNKKLCNIFFDSPRKIAETMIETINNKNKIKYTVKFLGAIGGLTGGFVLIKELDNPSMKIQIDSIHSNN